MGAEALITLLLGLVDRAASIKTLIETLRAEGRDKLTDSEWAALQASDDAARARLEAVIASKGGG